MATTIGGYVYPTTVMRARYGGTYSEGSWHAWPLDPWDVPHDAYGSDVVCATFWDDYTGIVGKGNNAQAAAEDLLIKFKQRASMKNQN